MAIGGGLPSTQVGIVVTLNTQPAVAGFTNLQHRLGMMQRGLGDLDIQLRRVDRTLQYIAAGSLIAAGAGFLRMAGEMERLEVRMSIFEKSTQGAQDRLDQLITMAQNSPFRLQAMTDAFVRLKSAGIEPIIDAEGNGPLKNLIDALAAFGGSEELLKRASIAIQQMAGKGVISMEELRQQLGEAIPTALRLMAEGMGISVSELIAQVSRGQVAFEEGIIPFFEKLEEKYGGAGELLANTFLGSINIMMTEINKLAVTFDRSGALDVFTAGFRLFTEVLRDLNEWVSGSLPGAVEDFLSLFDTYAPQIAAAYNAIDSVVTILWSIGEAIIGVLSILPPESLAIGFIGWVIAGPKGALLGAVLGPAIGSIEQIFTAVSSMAQGLVSMLTSLGIDVSSTWYLGILGWFLFGRFGRAAGLVITIIDVVTQAVNVAAAHIVATLVASIEMVKAKFSVDGIFGGLFWSAEAQTEGASAFEKAYQEVIDGFDLETTPLETVQNDLFKLFNGVSDESKVTADDVKDFGASIRQTLAEIAAARQKFEGTFGEPNNIIGLSDSQMDAVGRFYDMQNALTTRLASARAGGNEAAQFVASQLIKLQEVEGVLGELNQQMNEFLAAGNTEAAATLANEINSLSKGIGAFRAGLGELISIENRKIFDQIADSVSKVNATLVDYASQGAGPAQEAISQVNKQFEPLIRQIGEAREKLVGLTSGSQEYAIALALVEDAEKRVMEVREQALQRGLLLAARQMEDAQLARDKALEGMESTVHAEEIAQSFNKTAEALNRIQEKYRAFYDQLDSMAREWRRQVEDGTMPEGVYNESIARLDAVRARLEATQRTAVELALYETTAIGQLWQSVGETIEESVGGALEALITQTGSVKDVILAMYQDLTRAAINYLMTVAKMALFGEAGKAGYGNGSSQGWLNLGFSLFSLFGGGGGSGAVSGVPKFAKGGIINGPTLFGMAGEVPGEQEGIFPLKRDSQGRLGVRGQGGGGDTYNFTIHALDANSVRELLMREASTLVDALRSRNALNRGFR